MKGENNISHYIHRIALAALLVTLLAPAVSAQTVQSTAWLHDLGDGTYAGCHVTGENFATYRLTAQLGSTVQLTVRSYDNNTNVHTLTVEDTGARAGPIGPGESDTIEFTLDQAGSVGVLCDGQSNSLSGMIIVRQASDNDGGESAIPGFELVAVIAAAAAAAIAGRRWRA